MAPKLTKDQIQKMALSAVGFVILLYVYFSFFLGPLAKSRNAAEANIASLQAKLAGSKTEMTRAATLEKEATDATTRYAALQALSPEGAPIAWFPPRIKAFFANQQIDKVTTKPDGAAGVYKQAELAEWSKFSWQIDLPQTDFATVGKAVAALENNEPLLSISKLSIRAATEDAQFQQVVLSATTAIMKR